MIPDEEPKAASDATTQQASADKGRRRSRRGGRRHSRRRGERPPGAQPASAPVAREDESSDVAPESDVRAEADEPLEAEPQPQRRSEQSGGPRTAAITDAIDQVTRVIGELKHALDEMEEVLETLELAERQKIDDEREIESLQRALRQLHRPRESGPRH